MGGTLLKIRLIFYSLGLLVCSDAAFATTAQEAANAAAVYPHTITPDEKTVFESAVRRELKDPDSARFRWNPEVNDKGVYCGFVNAKNSYGGYTGFKLFMLFHDFDREGKLVAMMHVEKVFSPTRNGTSIGDAVNAQMCAEKGYNLAADQAQD